MHEVETRLREARGLAHKALCALEYLHSVVIEIGNIDDLDELSEFLRDGIDDVSGNVRDAIDRADEIRRSISCLEYSIDTEQSEEPAL
jgi:hypothetical protein